MAHSCPSCDQVCHCGGDIDDIIMDWTPQADRCRHWLKCEDAPDDDDDDDLFDDPFDDSPFDDNFDYAAHFALHERRMKKIMKERHRKVKPYQQPKKVHLSFNTGRLHLYSKRSVFIAMRIFEAEDLPF